MGWNTRMFVQYSVKSSEAGRKENNASMSMKKTSTEKHRRLNSAHIQRIFGMGFLYKF